MIRNAVIVNNISVTPFFHTRLFVWCFLFSDFIIPVWGGVFFYVVASAGQSQQIETVRRKCPESGHGGSKKTGNAGQGKGGGAAHARGGTGCFYKILTRARRGGPGVPSRRAPGRCAMTQSPGAGAHGCTYQLKEPAHPSGAAGKGARTGKIRASDANRRISTKRGAGAAARRPAKRNRMW